MGPPGLRRPAFEWVAPSRPACGGRRFVDESPVDGIASSPVARGEGGTRHICHTGGHGLAAGGGWRRPSAGLDFDTREREPRRPRPLTWKPFSTAPPQPRTPLPPPPRRP